MNSHNHYRLYILLLLHVFQDEEFLDAAESSNVSDVTVLLSMGIDVNCQDKVSTVDYEFFS